jgi:hypothetical protein
MDIEEIPEAAAKERALKRIGDPLGVGIGAAVLRVLKRDLDALPFLCIATDGQSYEWVEIHFASLDEDANVTREQIEQAVEQIAGECPRETRLASLAERSPIKVSWKYGASLLEG